MKIYIPNLSAISENFEREIVGFSQEMGEPKIFFGKKGWAYRFYWIPLRWGIAEEGKKHKWRTFLKQVWMKGLSFLGSIIFIPYVSVTGWWHLCALWDSGCKHLNLVGDIKVVCLVTSKKHWNYWSQYLYIHKTCYVNSLFDILWNFYFMKNL